MPSLTITMDAANTNRVAASLKRKENLDHSATVDDIKAFIITTLKELVADQERAAAQEAVKTSDMVLS